MTAPAAATVVGDADFETATDGTAAALVMLQVIAAPGAVAAALSEIEPVARFGVAVPPEPRPEQEAAVIIKLVDIVSEMTVAVEAAVSVLVAPVTGEPAVSVVIVSLPKPLVPE